MQKLESSLKNMVLVLVGVALIVGAVLAYINHLTSGPIAEKAAQEQEDNPGQAERHLAELKAILDEQEPAYRN